jgi:transcriptional regulator with XRE-family HTH domain
MLRVEELRRQADLSKAALARRAELNQATVSLVCNGRLVPGDGQLERLAAALDFAGDPRALLEDVNGHDD